MRNDPLRRHFVLGLAPAAAVAAAAAPQDRPAAGRAGGFNVRDHGAAGDGAHLDTKAIQDAVDACARAGGGTVFFPAGAYLSGTIVLKSRVTLDLDAGAVLLGSKNLQDYPSFVPALRSFTDTYTEKSLIYAEGLQDIGIRGRGVIDGQGAAFKGPYKVRPYMMRFVSCRNVSVTDVTIQNSPMWVQHYLACDEVEIRGIRVHSRVNGNNDGIDIDCSQRVRISDCEISSGDDAIVLKATAGRPSKDVVITNCVLSTACNALKLGTESNGGFENIAISNCTIYDTRLAGIALEMVDGGVLDRISISGIVMNGVAAPVFIRLGDRARPFTEGGARPPVGKLRNVSISNVQAVGAGHIGCAIAGLPGHVIENVVLENLRLTFAGGGKRADAHREIPENAEKYPEHSMFGTLPAYGFYCRHVKGLSLRNIETGFVQDDERPALVCDDVEGLELAGSAFAGAPEAEPSVRLKQVQDAFVHGCRAPGRVETWMEVSGNRCERISVMGNDLGNASKAVDIAGDVPKDAVFLNGNRVQGA
ncbi:MAG: glycoside hydrolase family 28 protein [Bryobacteraceae bacterium]|jgi:polygalacturonase